MTKIASRGATTRSLLLALCGAILAIYVFGVVSSAIRTPYYGPILILVVFPLIGSAFVTAICFIATLFAWACFVLVRRWIRNSTVWAGIAAVALTVVIDSAFYLLVGLLLPPLREPLQVLSFFLALAVIVTVCTARGVGSRMQLLAEPPALDEEQRRALDDAVDQARQHAARPSEDQAASDAADVMRRAILAKAAIREEELNGWTYVHDADDGPDDPAAGDR